jgi:hypothetical protein
VLPPAPKKSESLERKHEIKRRLPLIVLTSPELA